MSSLGGNTGFRDKPVAEVIKSIDDAVNAHKLVEVINRNMARLRMELHQPRAR